jgi:hypothetical protein
MVQEASAGASVVDALEVKPHAAALNARSVAGEGASPSKGLVRTCGVFGEESGCEGGLITGCVYAVSPCSDGLESPRLCDVEIAELAKENSRGSLKTGSDDFTGFSASAGPLRFFDWGFADAVLTSFGGLPRFFGAVSAVTASIDAGVAVFFGLPRFLGALSTATGFPDSAS